MGKLLHHLLQDHTPDHAEGCQWCSGTGLGCSSHMEHRPQPEHLVWGMHKVPQKDTVPWTHLQVADPCFRGICCGAVMLFSHHAASQCHQPRECSCDAPRTGSSPGS